MYCKEAQSTYVKVDFVEVAVRLEDDVHVVETCYLFMRFIISIKYHRRVYAYMLNKTYVLVSSEVVQQPILRTRTMRMVDKCSQIAVDQSIRNTAHITHLISLKHLFVKMRCKSQINTSSQPTYKRPNSPLY